MTENKRLGEVLSLIKARQHSLPAPKLKTNSEVINYQKRARKPSRRHGWIDERKEQRRREQAADAQSNDAGQSCDIEACALPVDAPRHMSE
ncbi:hypothetical protein HB779_00035 (plasmid) [Phyllobacterium sp. 628]|uniref:hypothetical protein n=1 Tax=Phyllobacterium sp. 628 TaxID=2718938 RepID=UPI0016622EAB|nr:hypothetical protein HB779_00035 [Phyllobacterium sp. 628]